QDDAVTDVADGVEVAGGPVGGGGEVLVDGVAVDLGAVEELAGDAARVGVQEQLGGVVPQPGGRVPPPVDAQAVALAGGDAGDVALPRAVLAAVEREAALAGGAVVLVDEAQVHGRGVRGEHGDVDAVAPQVSTQRGGSTGHPLGDGAGGARANG